MDQPPEQRNIGSSPAEFVAEFKMSDYPPGTPLPKVPASVAYAGNPLLRAWENRRLKKLQAAQQAQLETLRDEYWHARMGD